LYISSFEEPPGGTVLRVKWVPSRHSIARPQVGDGGDGCGKPTRGGHAARRVVVGVTTPHRKISTWYEVLHKASNFDGLFGEVRTKFLEEYPKEREN
jgi:hypothetical protein